MIGTGSDKVILHSGILFIKGQADSESPRVYFTRSTDGTRWLRVGNKFPATDEEAIEIFRSRYGRGT